MASQQILFASNFPGDLLSSLPLTELFCLCWGCFYNRFSHLLGIDCTISIIFLPITTFFRCFKRFSAPQWVLSCSCWAISQRSRGGTTTCPARATAHPLSLISALRNVINLWSLWSYFGVNSDKSISFCGKNALFCNLSCCFISKVISQFRGCFPFLMTSAMHDSYFHRLPNTSQECKNLFSMLKLITLSS